LPDGEAAGDGVASGGDLGVGAACGCGVGGFVLGTNASAGASDSKVRTGDSAAAAPAGAGDTVGRSSIAVSVEAPVALDATDEARLDGRGNSLATACCCADDPVATLDSRGVTQCVSMPVTRDTRASVRLNSSADMIAF